MLLSFHGNKIMKRTEVIDTTTPSVAAVEYVLAKSNYIYETYKDLINSYVLDFFTNSHWDNLPVSWKKYFKNIPPERLCDLLNLESYIPNDVMPLSFLSLKASIRHLRIPQTYSQNEENVCFDKKIDKIFWKHVKIKKKHELASLAEYTYEMALKTNCNIVVDVGSGLGHLCRMLSYTYGVQVCGIESQEQLVHQAKKLDGDFQHLATKHNPKFMTKRFTPVYVNMRVTDTLNRDEFIEIIRKALSFGDTNIQFGIVGLHPCGDLGPILLQLYKHCPNVRFVNVVGCCYMKITEYYPLSKFCLQLRCELTYHAREIACHAIDSYTERLKAGKHWELKVHAYRATLEKIITEKYPSLKHVAVGNVKYAPEMTFQEYCCKVLRKLNVELKDSDLDAEDIRECLGKWKDVVTFYTIRMLFAPVVESLIILDRFLYLREDGESTISTVFNPKLSPRNFVVSGIRM